MTQPRATGTARQPTMNSQLTQTRDMAVGGLTKEATVIDEEYCLLQWAAVHGIRRR